MFLIDKVPEYIFKSMNEEGVLLDEVMLAAYCDMNSDHVYCDTYVVATCKKLYVISGTLSIEKTEGKKRSEPLWKEASFEEYLIEEIDKLKCEELLSGARLTAKMKSGEYLFLSALTNTCRSSVLLFIKYFDRIKKGEIASPDFERTLTPSPEL